MKITLKRILIGDYSTGDTYELGCLSLFVIAWYGFKESMVTRIIVIISCILAIVCTFLALTVPNMNIDFMLSVACISSILPVFIFLSYIVHLLNKVLNFCPIIDFNKNDFSYPKSHGTGDRDNRKRKAKLKRKRKKKKRG